MKKPPLRLLILTLVAAFLIFLAFFSWQPSLPRNQTVDHLPIPSPTPAAKLSVYIPTRASLPGQPALQAAQVVVSSNPAERSHIADSLNLSTQDPKADLSIVANLFEEYRRTYGAFPSGEDNRQILNALSGNNSRKLIFIAHNHPALNPAGALLDRWGTPYFFHFQSSQEVGIRSAGPDHDFYTADDLVREMR